MPIPDPLTARYSNTNLIPPLAAVVNLKLIFTVTAWPAFTGHEAPVVHALSFGGDNGTPVTVPKAYELTSLVSDAASIAVIINN